MSLSENLIVEELSPFVDPRGTVYEPIQGPELALQGGVHVVVTEPGHIRGNHLHPRGREICVVTGPALVRVREVGGVRDTLVSDGTIVRFTFPPGMPHAIQNTGNKPHVLVSFNTVAYDPECPDLERDLLIPPPS